MRILFGLSVAMLIVVAVNSLVAQDTGLFNGNGIRDSWGNADNKSMDPKSSLGGIRSMDDGSGSKSNWKMPKFAMPKLNMPKLQMPNLFKGDMYPKPMEFSDSSKRGVLNGFPKFDLLSGSDTTQPNFFQRMNNRTKEMFGRTRDGFSNLGERSRLTWDSVTRSITGDAGGSSSRNAPPMQPNLRSARKADEMTDKF